MATMTAASAVHTFSSQPKAVTGRRAKYRDPGIDGTLGEGEFRELKETTISWDKRVHRGNTYSVYTRNAAAASYAAASSPQATRTMRRKARPKEPSLFEMGLPEAERVPVDLVDHLVEKVAVVEVAPCEAQTDEFMPEPPPAQYLPQKTGVDVETQVEDGELFSFDDEVEPLLDVLVNKTLEQALMEVEEEYELASMKSFKEEWYQKQGTQMEDWQVQVDEEWARWRHKEEVAEQKRAQKRQEAQVLLKIQAMSAAHMHLAQLVPNAVKDLMNVSLDDARQVAIEQSFLPGLINTVKAEVEGITRTRVLASEAVTEVVTQSLATVRAAQAEQRQRYQEMERRWAEEAQIRRGNIRIWVDDGKGGKVAVGPITITSDDVLEEAQERIFAWLQENEPELSAAWPWGVVLCLEGEPIDSVAAVFSAKAGQISLQPKPEPAQALEEQEGDLAEGDEEAEDPAGS